ncbi:glycosyltransferase family 2 protein [Acidicapsa dinghuensis]|uniref:Glycosyltransferase family 2 protein n=1 Tax=Acidicapsa dinghuensis TaxID=2218256 RepID=A0ABW1EEX9_9BACT|nr:glycosyltransferase family 2 protein [Acidicapsa dinghuensis]
MTLHLLLTLAGIALVAITLPLVLELFIVTSANLLRGRKNAPSVADNFQESNFPLTVIVPAHNEQLLVSHCVTSLKTSATSATRILVIAHNCSDSTAARAAAAGADVLELNDPGKKGKGFALRYGFEKALAAGASAVMVVDADSAVSPDTVPAVVKAFVQGSRVVQCRYEMVSASGAAGTRLAALAFRGFNVVRPRGRQNLGLSAGILGNGFAMAREVLEANPYEAFSVVEDLEYHLHLVMAGERVHYLDQVLVSAEFPESRSGEQVQRSRWEGGRFRTARVWAMPLVGKILSGQIRLLEPLCDLTGLPLAYGVFALLVAICLPLTWLRWYATFSLGTVLVHVLTAAWAGDDFLGTLKLLALAPLYILRKLWMIPGIARGASAKAAWIRTERNNTL